MEDSAIKSGMGALVNGIVCSAGARLKTSRSICKEGNWIAVRLWQVLISWVGFEWLNDWQKSFTTSKKAPLRGKRSLFDCRGDPLTYSQWGYHFTYRSYSSNKPLKEVFVLWFSEVHFFFFFLPERSVPRVKRVETDLGKIIPQQGDWLCHENQELPYCLAWRSCLCLQTYAANTANADLQYAAFIFLPLVRPKIPWEQFSSGRPSGHWMLMYFGMLVSAYRNKNIAIK